VATVAAGFTPGEADRLRRSIAAWRRRGSLEQFEQRLINGMVERGYGAEFARRIYRQILGFGEYGFPESHAASFALLVYVSAWLKWHEPAAFFAAILNSQPMGFYAPAQLVGEARRQEVKVLPVDACRSEYDCTLEGPLGRGGSGNEQPSLRLGLRMVKGLSQKGVERLIAARVQWPFTGVGDMARRVQLNRADLQALAAAGALDGIAGNRHQAAWEVMGLEEPIPLLESAHQPGTVSKESVPLVMLPVPTEGQDILADFATVGLTLKRHPLALLRRHLRRRGAVPVEQVHSWEHGRLIRIAGIVISRQHPASANSVTFITLEDETGQANLVVWKQVAERQRKALLGARLLAVVGEVQREGEVVHVIAKQLRDFSSLLGGLVTRSRDFR